MWKGVSLLREGGANELLHVTHGLFNYLLHHVLDIGHYIFLDFLHFCS